MLQRTLFSTSAGFQLRGNPLRKTSRREREVERQLRTAGRFGMTRHELADALACPLSSVCAIVANLKGDGQVVDTPRKRTSTFGYPAGVLVHHSFAD